MNNKTTMGVLFIASMALAGCETTGVPWSKPSSSEPKQEAKTETAAKPESKSGVFCNKPVKDSTSVSEGEGCHVKGLNDWEGEIAGIPGSKFNKLKIGMTMRQVMDLIGHPSDEGAYVTGKAWIPFYFGSDRYRYEMVYKNAGRLVFAGGGVGDYSSGHLIWVINNPDEGAYR